MNLRLLPFGFYYIIGFVVISWVLITYVPISFNHTNSFTFSVLSSFTAGILLAGVIFILLRPNVKIVDKIAKGTDKNGNVYHKFKFINNSFFSAFDVNVEAYVCKGTLATNNGDGINISLERIELKRHNWIYLSRWRPLFEGTIYAPHCITVTTKNSTDLESLITKNLNYLEFRVTLQHAFSNLRSTYRMKYGAPGCIHTGNFSFGNSFKII